MPTLDQEPSRDTAPAGGLFDGFGRLVPAEGDTVYSVVDRRYFSLAKPSFSFRGIRESVARHLNLPSLGAVVSLESFERRCETIRARALANPALASLFSGVHVPFLLVPDTATADIGEELEQMLLPAVGRSFNQSMPGFDCKNYCDGQLAKKLDIVPNVRYERLVKQHASQVVVGWYFPACMAGFSIPCQRRLVSRLPDALILSGPLEAAMAFIGVPGILMRMENYPNLLALSAVQPSADPRMFQFFEAYGWNLNYNQRSMVGAVSEYFAGGLTLCE